MSAARHWPTSAGAASRRRTSCGRLTSPAAPRAVDDRLASAFAVADYLLFYAGAATAIVAPWWIVKVAGVVISGIAVAMLFALAHDAAHGSLAASRRAEPAPGDALLPAVVVSVHAVDSRPQPSAPRVDQRRRVRLLVAAGFAGRSIGRCRAGAGRSSTSIAPGGACGSIRSSRSGGSTWRCRATTIAAILNARHLDTPIGCSSSRAWRRRSVRCAGRSPAWSTLCRRSARCGAAIVVALVVVRRGGSFT